LKSSRILPRRRRSRETRRRAGEVAECGRREEAVLEDRKRHHRANEVFEEGLELGRDAVKARS
jgi:hypothetical protein